MIFTSTPEAVPRVLVVDDDRAVRDAFRLTLEEEGYDVVLAEHGETYLNPTLKALFPDPSSFMDMDRAATVLLDALERRRSMVVFADYDVDGDSPCTAVTPPVPPA